MNTPDLINGLFEASGALAMLGNVARLRKDKQTRGVCWTTTLFFTSWGLWNLFYYPNLNQPLSFFGGLALAIANGAYLFLMVKYRRN